MRKTVLTILIILVELSALAAPAVTGKVTAGGKPVAGVLVSDNAADERFPHIYSRAVPATSGDCWQRYDDGLPMSFDGTDQGVRVLVFNGRSMPEEHLTVRLLDNEGRLRSEQVVQRPKPYHIKMY